MKIIYSWLKDFIDIDIPAQELADSLTSLGIEVASVRQTKVPPLIKVGRVLKADRHPNADRLSLCSVDIGSPEPLSIVCGAPNVTTGMTVACATIGAVLGPDFTIKKSKIRGVESFGMLCSEQELGLSNDHSGLISLPDHFKIGEELSVYYPDDAVIEIEITPDRGYCLSIIGIAREIAARYGLPLKNPGLLPLETNEDPIGNSISVTIEDPEGCPRYTGRLVRKVKIAPSPEWMQQRLILAGQRPINNVVDVTNYIMLQYGQPMHAFDYQLIQDKSIIVKKAESSQTFTTLDNQERKLEPDDLLIHDGKRPVALAGIMGGAGSEISATTTEVFLECAFFNQAVIRKTSKRIGLSTDSSYRFERGVDPDKGLIDALDTAAALIQKLGQGTVAAGRIDRYPTSLKKRVISIRQKRTSTVLGVDLSLDQIGAFLSSLGMECIVDNNGTISCIVPLYRHDLIAEEDLIEEVGRLYGYDNIPAHDRAPVFLQHALPTYEHKSDTLRSALAWAGFHEIMTNSMTSEHLSATLTPSVSVVALKNPLTPDMAVMKTTMAGTMLEALAYNLNRKNQNNKFFELGKTFSLAADNEAKEQETLGILIEGNYWQTGWNTVALPVDLYGVKGTLQTLAHHLNLGVFEITARLAPDPLFDGDAASIKMGTTITGKAGTIAKKVLDIFGIKSNVCYVELTVGDYLHGSLVTPVFKPLPKFPALERDFCFVMPDHVSAQVITDEIRSLSPLVHDVAPFDLYRGDKLGAGVKSIAFSVKLLSAERTLTDTEGEDICSRIIVQVREKFGATLRV